MKIISSNREIIYSSVSGESFSYAPETPTVIPDKTSKQLTKEFKAEIDSPKKKFDWNIAKSNATKFGTFLKDTGALDFGKQVLVNKYGGKKPTTNGLTPEKTTQITIDENKPMSTGVKVAIGLGVATVLGLIIYKATRK